MATKEEIAAEQKLNELLAERAVLEDKASRLYAKKQGRSKEMNKTKTELLKIEEKIVKAEEAAYAATKQRPRAFFLLSGDATPNYDSSPSYVRSVRKLRSRLSDWKQVLTRFWTPRQFSRI